MKLTVILTAAALVLALTGCAASGQGARGAENAPHRAQENPITNVSPEAEKKPVQQTLLTREEAVAAALKDAGLAEADIRDLEAELDRDRDTAIWEVGFETANMEYDYEINAVTGKVLRVKTEKEKEPAVQSSATQDGITQKETKPAQSQEQKLLTREEAVSIALKAAGVAKADVRDLEAELDRERATTVWEVDFEVGNTDYSYDIDAATGKILHQEKERD